VKFPEATREAVMKELRIGFRPEFLNRIDDIVIFKPLQREEIKRIVGLQIESVLSRLSERSIRIEISDSALTHIADAAYEPAYGARPLKRYIQRHLETPIARMIISGEIADGDCVVVVYRDGKLSLEVDELLGSKARQNG
jgi:ATP-dependent Clp protease ATP-binding subunit ClpB